MKKTLTITSIITLSTFILVGAVYFFKQQGPRLTINVTPKDAFIEIENKIRVATSYGKRHNGVLLEKTKESFNKIEKICLDRLK